MEDAVTVDNRVEGSGPHSPIEVEIMTSILQQLGKIDAITRERILQSIATFYGTSLKSTPLRTSGAESRSLSSASENMFSEDRSISAKQFLLEKQPKTDVEKVACLAYYLTHYRSTQHFKTLDISKLNTEAAQAKFANAAVAVENATKRNYLVPSTKGNKQLSALGEQFVQALPDRDKAHAIMAAGRPRRKFRRFQDQSGDA